MTRHLLNPLLLYLLLRQRQLRKVRVAVIGVAARKQMAILLAVQCLEITIQCHCYQTHLSDSYTKHQKSYTEDQSHHTRSTLAGLRSRPRAVAQ